MGVSHYVCVCMCKYLFEYLIQYVYVCIDLDRYVRIYKLTYIMEYVPP